MTTEEIHSAIEYLLKADKARNDADKTNARSAALKQIADDSQYKLLDQTSRLVSSMNSLIQDMGNIVSSQDQRISALEKSIQELIKYQVMLLEELQKHFDLQIESPLFSVVK